ncbi:protein phosphatase [Lottiidibacillus patelloidae]|uniref:protein-serine/threonine phosphatase n=1 Tax=Lottiidibacillus patelloidae TaxID=2670334 RepID=A0A263BY76_9BACI|nr:Stp1/IreP family PP2C-type Ser/Thr phosphatase [Lottiidibacillus patelloidae]OZM58548.1 protein phosphatase [Lottiidibacillus patelloidae]
MESVFITDRGKVRELNEDCGGIFTNKTNEKLVVIADGMGGHRAGDVASNMTVDLFKQLWEQIENIDSPDQAENWFSEVVLEVNKQILAHSKSNEHCEGMGTTIVATILTKDFATICHIGDSRCYIVNDSSVQLLTQDHSLVNELLKSGQITELEADNHPKRNVLIRALGTDENVEASIQTIGWDEGDTMLLCSDGLSDKLQTMEMESILLNGQNVKLRAERLVELANENGGEDNISVALVEHKPVCSEGGC